MPNRSLHVLWLHTPQSILLRVKIQLNPGPHELLQKGPFGFDPPDPIQNGLEVGEHGRCTKEQHGDRYGGSSRAHLKPTGLLQDGPDHLHGPGPGQDSDLGKNPSLGLRRGAQPSKEGHAQHHQGCEGNESVVGEGRPPVADIILHESLDRAPGQGEEAGKM